MAGESLPSNCVLQLCGRAVCISPRHPLGCAQGGVRWPSADAAAAARASGPSHGADHRVHAGVYTGKLTILAHISM